jgi:hypothetical protein
MVRAKQQIVRPARIRWLLLRFVALIVTLTVVGGASAGNKLRRQSGQSFTGEERIEAEQRLFDLGYWTGPVDGELDPAFRHALTAFQKVEGRNRTGRLTREELEALRTAVKPVPRHQGQRHIEIDLTRQVLLVVDSNTSIERILPVSTGNEKSYLDHGEVHRARTPRGNFKVLHKIAGWRRSTLGLLYYPNYIHQGIAVHGSVSVPAYPASHGCIRIPMYAAIELSRLMPIGMDVMVYE